LVRDAQFIEIDNTLLIREIFRSGSGPIFLPYMLCREDERRSRLLRRTLEFASLIGSKPPLQRL
jgi:hypothetical protein